MGLYENMLNEPVSRLNLREAITVPPAASIRDAVQVMRKHTLGCVVVIDEEQKPTGIFSEAMLRRMITEDPVAINDSICNRMARQFPKVDVDEPVITVMEAMHAENHRFVVVQDATGQIAGLTGQKGLMEYIADHFPELIMTQTAGAKPPSRREGA